MTGIREMFAEYSGHEEDWFQLAFAFEMIHASRRERHRQSQRRYDLRKHGPRRSRRGRPSLGLTAEQMRQRRRVQNRGYYLERRSA